ncbi:MAG: GNAT family N-acetyltransferase [Proteobacteria bacterium]|nr:MAG: GNAT family N-acetyltransferase [Pseudomonadota bacterium]
MRSITLIPATESDLDRIDLNRGGLEDLVKSGLYDLAAATAKAKKENARILKLPTSSLMLCFEEEEEVGHVLLDISETELSIVNLEVYDELRGKDYGPSILLAVEQLAVEKDLNRIAISIAPSNKKALNLCKSSGFSELFVHLEKRL